jgi:hypothetical protein
MIPLILIGRLIRAKFCKLLLLPVMQIFAWIFAVCVCDWETAAVPFMRQNLPAGHVMMALSYVLVCSVFPFTRKNASLCEFFSLVYRGVIVCLS